MKVSIIIPVYNVAPYIERCLKSVMSQTYPNIECILVDDCGSDESMDIARQLILNYNGAVNFILLQHDHNKGQSAARNYAIKVATGDYIYFLDSDDAITPNCIEVLGNLAIKYPDVDMVQGNTTTIHKEFTEEGFTCDVPEYSCEKELLYHLFLNAIVKNVGNRFVNRSFIIDNNLFFPEGILHEDYFWLFFVTKKIKSAAFTKEHLYLYYMNENSVMNTVRKDVTKRRIEGFKTSATAFFNDIIQHGSTSKYHRQYLADALINYCLLLSESKAPFKLWNDFWSMVLHMSLQMKGKLTLSRILLGISMLPPLCFLVKKQWWQWRLRHYICQKI